MRAMNASKLRRPDERDKMHGQWEQFSEGGLFESTHIRKDGTTFPAEINLRWLQLEGRQVIVAVVRDVTERKRAEEELQRANRALHALSKCGDAVIHAGEEKSLLENVCEIIVDTGGYRMAWIGYVENDKANTVRPVAQKGYESGYLENVRVTWADTERGRGRREFHSYEVAASHPKRAYRPEFRPMAGRSGKAGLCVGAGPAADLGR